MSAAYDRKSRTSAALALGLLLVFARATPAAARARGIVTDNCQACHAGDNAGTPALSLTADPMTFNPGDLVTFTLAIRAANIKVGGAFISAGGVGTLRALAGEGLQINGQGLTHTTPKAASNGAVTFRFAWQAPAQPSGVAIGVAALAANGNNAPTGDSPGGGDFQWTFGCSPRPFFLDLDRDGYGSKTLGTRLGCATDVAPTGYAALDGDCDENNEKVYPGATEICNRKDDNCDGQTDEGSAPVVMWPDQDGDGYYKSQLGTPKTGCGDVPGYAALGGDCDDVDPAIHPAAVEICNLQDDDCNGKVDERVRPVCGLGWCSRQSLSCDPADCHVGPPMAETCNAFDDDCDGEIDNDACQAGYICAGGECVSSAGASGTASQGAVGHAGAGGSSAVAPPDPGMPTGTAGAPRAGGCSVVASLWPAGQAGRCQRGLDISLIGAACLGASFLRRRKRTCATFSFKTP